MSLKWTLSLIMSVMLLSMASIQWWLTQNTLADLQVAYGEASFDVARKTAQSLITNDPTLNLWLTKRDEPAAFIHPDGKKNLVRQAESKAARDITIQLKNAAQSTQIVLLENGVQKTVKLPRDKFNQALNQLNQNLLFWLSLLAIGFSVFGYFIFQLITSPIKQLCHASEEIGTGNYRPVQDIKSIGKEIKALIGGFNDMANSLKSLEKENNQLIQQQQIEDYKSVAQSFAHAIRNPLNTINLCLDEISNKEVELTSIAKNQVTQINQWVSDLTDTLQGKHRRNHPVDLVELLAECKANAAHSDQIKIINELSADERLIQANEQELKAIFTNILNNSIEAKTDCEIAIQLTEKQSQINISITDNGPGFSAPILRKLFKPHVSSKANGSGMGLFLARRIIRSFYQGDVTAKNNKQGATVSVILGETDD